MKMPLSLIRSYLDLDEPISLICETLTLLGIEVEGVENEMPFSGVCVAEVLRVEPHPSAHQLCVAEIDDGTQHWKIISGARNCRVGLKTAFARPGACLYDEKKEERCIEATSIRGVPSHGMLCAASELGLPKEEEEGLLELPQDWVNGEDLTPLLWDPILDLSLTPNLGHCMSALGIARELSVAFQKPLRNAPISPKESSFPIQKEIAISLENPSECPRYLCRFLKGVRVLPSPFWLRQALLKVGLNPINNVVDITNYLLIKTGQPFHAFDAEQIEGRTIIVRSNEKEQAFIGLDREMRTIPIGALLICDAKKPIALAGILGGLESAVTEKTHSIVLEAAAFDGLSVRKTARALGIRTESSQRFEKGTDQAAIPHVLNEACALILELAGGSLAKGTLECGAPPLPRELTLRTNHVNRILGTKFSVGEIKEFMQRLSCPLLKEEGSSLQLGIPSFRNDLLEEIDLVEEVARIYGYNNIDRAPPLCTVSSLSPDPLFLFEQQVRNQLVANGLQEIITCDLISPKLAQLSPEHLYPKSPLLTVNAKTEEYSILRPSLLAGNLEVVRINFDQQQHSLALFEMGTIYLPGPQEVSACSIVLTGMNRPHHWERKPLEWDFYDLKGILESLFLALNCSPLTFRISSHPTFHPGRQVNLFHEELLIGALGEIHPHLLAKLDIKQPLFFAELNLFSLQNLKKETTRFVPLPLFPSTERDWTFTLPQHIRYEQLLPILQSLHIPLLTKAELIDLYERKATLRFTYRDLFKTISFEEAEAAHAAAIAEITENLV